MSEEEEEENERRKKKITPLFQISRCTPAHDMTFFCLFLNQKVQKRQSLGRR
jgi:hypothetical protein